jgi:hypothetical protein
MRTITPEIKKKLQKILALAKKGSEGEQENARNMLQELLSKYNITIDDIADDIACEVEKEYIFRKINNKMEFKLWTQIIFKVRNVHSFKYFELKGGKYSTKCTEAERIEIENQFGFHKRLFRNEYKKQLKNLQEELLSAYVNKHNLYSNCPDEEEQYNPEEQQPIDLEKLQRILAYKRNLSEETYYKMLENGTGKI